MDETANCPIDISNYKNSLESSSAHQLHSFKLLNHKLKEFIHSKVIPDIRFLEKNNCQANINTILDDFRTLFMVDTHYNKKETIISYIKESSKFSKIITDFIVEDDHIRKGLKEVINLISNYSCTNNDGIIKDEIVNKAKVIVNKMLEMISKERDSSFISAMEEIKEEDWIKIDNRFPSYGYYSTIFEQANIVAKDNNLITLDNNIIFETGYLDAKEICYILNSAPMDLCFIDSNDNIKYFSKSPNRIFDIPNSTLGKHLLSYQGPISPIILTEVLKDFKKGTLDTKEYNVNVGEDTISIKYMAIRDGNNKYLGSLETIQNISILKKVT